MNKAKIISSINWSESYQTKHTSFPFVQCVFLKDLVVHELSKWLKFSCQYMERMTVARACCIYASRANHSPSRTHRCAKKISDSTTANTIRFHQQLTPLQFLFPLLAKFLFHSQAVYIAKRLYRRSENPFQFCLMHWSVQFRNPWLSHLECFFLVNQQAQISLKTSKIRIILTCNSTIGILNLFHLRFEANLVAIFAYQQFKLIWWEIYYSILTLYIILTNYWLA